MTVPILFREYIWLVNTIYKARKISLSEINDKWIETEMSGGVDRVVLVVRLSALGDVAMTVPAIYSVARCYSETSFKVLTRRLPARLFMNSPSNVTVITLSSKLALLNTFPSFPTDLFS